MFASLIDRQRLRRMARMPYASPRIWMRQAAMWVAALLIAVIAIGFARAATWVTSLFVGIATGRPVLAVVIPTAGLAVSALLTRYVFPGAQGSGIPQTIAALHMLDAKMIDAVLSLRIAVGKILLTLLGLACGASIGREGPTVQVGASIMHALGRLLKLPRIETQHALVLAGGAAGIAGAFNTPLAGIVFAIEELSHSFESRTSGTVLTAVIVGGIATIALAGNYSYFGVTSVQLNIGAGWFAVLVCGVCGGIAGGLFARLLLLAARGLPGRAGRFVMRHPIAFAAICGCALGLVGLLAGGSTYGTGYDQARGLLEGRLDLHFDFFVLKFAATVISYISGIPGGIFSPCLAVGAGLGHALEPLVPHAPAAAMILLGMVGYFAGAVQAPITATVIVMEMVDNQQMTIPLMATAMVAFGVSRLICRRPLYSALARRFLSAMERPQ
jgi:H+/Cl- antiporter ClcA